jgi:hypothetical protein
MSLIQEEEESVVVGVGSETHRVDARLSLAVPVSEEKIPSNS